MSRPSRNWNRTYRLTLHDDAGGTGRTIEFDASGPDAALEVAQQTCLGREVELWEDGRSLGRLRWTEPGGFWVISPPETVRVHN